MWPCMQACQGSTYGPGLMIMIGLLKSPCLNSELHGSLISMLCWGLLTHLLNY